VNTRIMTRQCVVGNEREPRLSKAGIEELAVDIRDHGMKHPILVYDQYSELLSGKVDINTIDQSRYMVIDGLARLQASELLGYVTIEAMITDDLAEACHLLTKSMPALLDPVRLGEILDDLQPLVERRRGIAFLARRGKDATEQDFLTASELIGKTFGLSVNEIKRFKLIYRTLRRSGEEGAQLLDAVRRNELTYHMAYSRIKRVAKPVTRTSKEQIETVQVLDNLTRSLLNIIRAGEQMASGPVGIPAEDLERSLVELRKGRKRLSTVIHTLERELNSYDG